MPVCGSVEKPVIRHYIIGMYARASLPSGVLQKLPYKEAIFEKQID